MDLARPVGAVSITADDLQGTPAPVQTTQPVQGVPPVQPVVMPTQAAPVQPMAPAQTATVADVIQTGTPQAPQGDLQAANLKLRRELDERTIYGAAGDKATFLQMAEWANQNMSEADRGVLNQTLKIGTPEMKEYMVKEAMAKFRAGSTGQAPLVTGDRGNAPQVGVQGISRREYLTDYQNYRIAGKAVDCPEIRLLDQRRAAGIIAGIA